MSDAELAREWADKNFPRKFQFASEREYMMAGFLAGLDLAAGRAGLTWTATPPSEPGWYWFRRDPGSQKLPVDVFFPSGEPREAWLVQYAPAYGTSPLAAVVRNMPNCQWSPIPPPREPT